VEALEYGMPLTCGFGTRTGFCVFNEQINERVSNFSVNEIKKIG